MLCMYSKKEYRIVGKQKFRIQYIITTEALVYLMPRFKKRVSCFCIGVVHKLRLQEEVGRRSRIFNFYKVGSVNNGGQVVKKSQKLVNVVCERPHTAPSIILLVKMSDKITQSCNFQMTPNSKENSLKNIIFQKSQN